MSLSSLSALLRKQEAALLESWLKHQAQLIQNRGRVGEADLRRQSREFLELLEQTLTEAGANEPERKSLAAGALATPVFKDLRRFIEGVSASRSQLGFSPAETAQFVFSFKQPLFAQIDAQDREAAQDTAALFEDLVLASDVLDELAVVVMEAYQKAREAVILREQQQLLELSTPVVKLWDGVLALPIIGTLDSSRAQSVMESLLDRIVATGSEIAIIDITGVPTVDTLTAQHLLKTVTAARLMGAECIISGIRPQIAQTIVHLGVELGDVITKATLADAFKVALDRSNFAIVKRAARVPAQRG